MNAVFGIFRILKGRANQPIITFGEGPLQQYQITAKP